MTDKSVLHGCAPARMGLPVPDSRRNAAGAPSAYLRVCTAWALLSAITLFSAGCGGHKRQTKLPPPPPISGSTAKTSSRATTDSSLADINPKAKAIWTQTGLASWYGPPYHNRQGANGEIYDQNALTAAHKTLPMNSVVRVVNLQTSHQVVVRITDRGPFVGDRIIDLSVAAAKAVDVWRPGTAEVRLDVLEAPRPIDNGGRWCVQVGAFTKEKEALKLKDHLQRRYQTARILEFAGPTGYWVRVRVADDDKHRAQEVAKLIQVDEGGVFMVRLD